MSVSKPLWIRGRWEPQRSSHFSWGTPFKVLGAATNHTRVGLGKCRWFQESSWGKKLKEMKVGLFPSGNCMKPQQLCKDDSFVQKTAQLQCFQGEG